jgi:hypothetical protein
MDKHRLQEVFFLPLALISAPGSHDRWSLAKPRGCMPLPVGVQDDWTPETRQQLGTGIWERGSGIMAFVGVFLSSFPLTPSGECLEVA